jgi:hypothetical protein
VVSLTTRFGDLDLASSPSGFSTCFDALRRASTTMTIEDVSVLVASLDNVITSKGAAGRDEDFQARPHLIHLRQKQQKLDGRDDDLHEDADRQCSQRACLDTIGNPLISTKPVAAQRNLLHRITPDNGSRKPEGRRCSQIRSAWPQGAEAPRLYNLNHHQNVALLWSLRL